MSTFTHLHEFVRDHRERLLATWHQRVEQQLGAEGMSRAELVNHMPRFLDELVAGLREPDGPTPLPDESATAPEHGRQRLRVGFDVDQVVREYGILGDVVLDAVTEAGGVLTARDVRVLFRSLNTGAAEAIAAYVDRRDEELRQQAARHLGFVAHELRNPLGAAWSAYHVVKRTLASPNARALDLLERSLGRLKTLIDQVLVAGRLEAGAEPLYEPIAIGDLVDEAVQDAASEAEDKGVRVVTEVEAGLTLDGDRRLLASALGNLMRNAVKFSGAGETVTVRARRDGTDVALEVEDRCGGLAPTVGDEVFEAFVQRGEDRTGLGLGLAIAKQAVEAHGGDIRVRNIPGDGCVFRLRLPCAEGSTPAQT